MWHSVKWVLGDHTGGEVYPHALGVLVYAIIWNRITVVEAEEVRPNSFGRGVQRMVMFFYSNNGLLASTLLEWIQGGYNVLPEIFNHVRLHTNVCNMIGMVCQPCRVSVRLSEEDYRIRMTGEGFKYQAHLQQRFCCL